MWLLWVRDGKKKIIARKKKKKKWPKKITTILGYYIISPVIQKTFQTKTALPLYFSIYIVARIIYIVHVIRTSEFCNCAHLWRGVTPHQDNNNAFFIKNIRGNRKFDLCLRKVTLVRLV